MATEKRLIDANAFECVCVNGKSDDFCQNDYPECDKCGYMPVYDHMIDDIWCSPCCPNCGAKMDGDGNG